MNLIFAMFWLGGAIALFSYEYATGQAVLRIRGLNISSAWFMLVMAAWSFARWYSVHAFRKEQEALRIVHEARLRQARHHARPIEPDPTFDFSDKTPPTPRPPSDSPPSAN
jgi:hypothetical protein